MTGRRGIQPSDAWGCMPASSPTGSWCCPGGDRGAAGVSRAGGPRGVCANLRTQMCGFAGCWSHCSRVCSLLPYKQAVTGRACLLLGKITLWLLNNNKNKERSAKESKSSVCVCLKLLAGEKLDRLSNPRSIKPAGPKLGAAMSGLQMLPECTRCGNGIV